MAELLTTQIECETIAGRRKRLPHKTRQCFCSMWGRRFRLPFRSRADCAGTETEP
jgi:hypothetical protein